MTPEERAEKIAFHALAYIDDADMALTAAGDIVHIATVEIREAVEEALLQRWDESKQAIISHAIFEAYEDAATIAENALSPLPTLKDCRSIPEQIRARAAEDSVPLPSIS
jgi:hypothetical protein